MHIIQKATVLHMFSLVYRSVWPYRRMYTKVIHQWLQTYRPSPRRLVVVFFLLGLMILILNLSIGYRIINRGSQADTRLRFVWKTKQMIRRTNCYKQPMSDDCKANVKTPTYFPLRA